MRNKKGQFDKGYTYRQPKPYWNNTWLYREYITKQKSAELIAKEQGCKKNNILYYLNKFNIPTRSMKDIRKIKKWGLHGKSNPMYGKTGKLNPNWNGGHSPERQCSYAKAAWKELAKSILKRDCYLCRECGAKHTPETKLIVHHIKEWSKYPELRFEPENLITLCVNCHKKKHSRSKSIR